MLILGSAKIYSIYTSQAVFNGQVIVALSGDRAPFATSGRKLKGPTGYRIVRVDNEFFGGVNN